MADFNGTREEALKIVEKLGGDPKAFNAKYDNITINGRPVKGLRFQGEGKPIKINYSDVVDRYQGSRNSALEVQKSGPDTFPKPGKGKKIHHIRPPSLYQTFFEGLSPEDAAELARYSAEDLMTPLGNKDANAATLNQWEHDQAYHSWDRSNDGVKPSQTPSKRPQTGNPNTDPIRNFEMPKEATLDQRKAALKVFIEEGPQRLMDEQLYIARMASKHPNHPDVQRQFLDTFNVGTSTNKQIQPPPGMDLNVTNAIADPTTGRIRPQVKVGNGSMHLKVAKFVKNPAVRRTAALFPFAGTLIGAGTVEANAASRDEEIAANPNDPTLHVNKALDQISGWGDRTSLAGMAATATGAGAPVGVPTAAVGELTSLGAGLASMAIDVTRGTINLFRNPEKIKEIKPANMEFTTM